MRIIIFSVLISVSTICVSQELSRSVLGTSGFTESNGDFLIHATVGQSISSTFQTSYGDLRQGFQQPLEITQTSVIELEGTSLSIYPNPTSGDFVLRFNSPLSDKFNLSVIDITGKRVIDEVIMLQSGLSNSEFSLEGYSSGIYTVVVTSSFLSFQERIILH
jgi:hypothetical protein